MSGVMEYVDVSVPVRTAYDQWTQFEQFPQFMEGVQEVRHLSPTMTHWTVEIAGVRREFDAEITEQLPDERIAWRSIGGTQHAGVVTFHRLDAHTSRVTLQLDFEPRGGLEHIGDTLGMVDHRAKGDLERFKQFIEGRDQPTGAWRGKVDRPQP
ncbi:SRPBCC family protein [Salinispora mooreana]|uniref:SRPBCC family protein n=1 Tax=Salinispora mooreana TaxID=999545 RepID=UPI00037D0571|nr:SRPBCC family protein [Salinispora mooreana]